MILIIVFSYVGYSPIQEIPSQRLQATFYPLKSKTSSELEQFLDIYIYIYIISCRAMQFRTVQSSNSSGRKAINYLRPNLPFDRDCDWPTANQKWGHRKFCTPSFIALLCALVRCPSMHLFSICLMVFFQITWSSSSLMISSWAVGVFFFSVGRKYKASCWCQLG